MLDTIRLLTRNVKLKEIIIANFIPEETAKSIERRAVWKDEDDMWLIPVSINNFYFYFIEFILKLIRKWS